MMIMNLSGGFSVSQWVVEYIYLDASGDSRISIDTIEAPSKQEAINKAAKIAPFEEFMITVFAKSNDQELGTVKHSALEMTGQGQSEIKQQFQDDDD